jgi:hypothetical protein
VKLTSHELTVLAASVPVLTAWGGAAWAGRTQKRVAAATAASQKALAEQSAKAQHDLAAEQRVWVERKSAYVAELEHVERLSVMRSAAMDGSVDVEANYDPDIEEWIQRSIPLRAWASDAVIALSEACWDVHLGWLRSQMARIAWRAEKTAEAHDEAPASGEDFGTLNREHNDAVKAAAANADAADEMLRKAIRAELHAGLTA